MPSMTEMMSAIFWLLWLMPSIDPITSPTAWPPRSATALAADAS